VESGEPLFRREAGRMVAALARIFGVHNIALAEDVVQDAFCRALEVWKIRGVPDNPSAWLMRTAKNRAIDVLRRERTVRDFAPELERRHESEWTLVPTVEEMFTASAIKDDQLRMMFSCCHPRLSEQAQIALILSLLCGFDVGEIASAFLSGKSAIEKRIARGKKVLAGSKHLFDLADREFSSRLAAVQRALYLLFNEGYHGASAESAVRVELCREAMRLAALLLENRLTATPATYALCALMWLHAARLPARVDAEGDLQSLFDQDRSRWDAQLAARGVEFLDRSAAGDEVTEYHVEAAIASVHACARRPEETDWAKIVSLYDTLMAISPSPVVALNRAIAIAQRDGPSRGLDELRAIQGQERLAGYPFYHAAFGELELRRGHFDAAREHFRSSIGLARNPMERRFLLKRVERCDQRESAPSSLDSSSTVPGAKPA
jgi:RNA polymerase sigma factor (sigma-70 family)